MRLKLFKRYFLTTSFIILFSLTGMMVILTFVFNSHMAMRNYETLVKTGHAVVEHTQQLFEADTQQENQNDLLYDILVTVDYVYDVDVFIADTQGIILACSCDEWGEKQTCVHSSVIIPTDLIERTFGGDTKMEINSLGIYEAPQQIAAEAISANGKNVGIVVVTAPMSAVSQLIKTLIKLYFTSAIVPIVIMFIAIYIMTYRLAKPLKQMSLAAKAMAKGDFSRRIPVTGDDEIGELAVSFNKMTNSLAQLEGMRRSFVANVSHELKTPMTTIGGFIDGIIDGTIEKDKQEYYLGIVSSEVKRLSRLVQSMLEIAKLESGEFVLKEEDFNFRELLLEIVIGQEQRIEQKSLDIIGLDSIDNITLKADRDLIHQVVYNLVDNAIKFSNEGGSISFALRTDGKRLYFSISNTGKGIPQESLAHVFERFYKTDRSRSANKNSTGLGLHIAKTIIKSHGGTISVSSRENEFTAFEISLPLIK